MSAPRTLTPTARGAKILERIDAKFPSIGAAALVAGMHEQTLRRWIYTDPSHVSRSVVARFAKIGVPQSVLLS